MESALIIALALEANLVAEVRTAHCAQLGVRDDIEETFGRRQRVCEICLLMIANRADIVDIESKRAVAQFVVECGSEVAQKRIVENPEALACDCAADLFGWRREKLRC